MHGAMSCVQLFNYYLNVTDLENLTEVLPCECVSKFRGLYMKKEEERNTEREREEREWELHEKRERK